MAPCSCMVIAVLAVSGVVLGAWYMLWLVQRVFFGPLKEPHARRRTTTIDDLSLREILALAPLVVFVVWIGLRPGDFLSRMQPTLGSRPQAGGRWQLDRASPPTAAHSPTLDLRNRPCSLNGKPFSLLWPEVVLIAAATCDLRRRGVHAAAGPGGRWWRSFPTSPPAAALAVVSARRGRPTASC